MSLWQTFKRRAFRCLPVETMMAQMEKSNNLRRILGLADIIMLGIAHIIGTGIFVLTGEIANQYAGPSVIVAYIVAAFVVLCTAFVYAEFSADIPISGASYNFIALVFGEGIAWLVASSTIIKDLVAHSSVAKGLAGYFCTLIGLDSGTFTFNLTNEIVLDPFGAFVILCLTALMIIGLRESIAFTNVAISLSLLVMFFIIGSSVKFIKAENYTPFIPEEFGITGIAKAGSIAVFSYLGYEALANVSEECKNPRRDVPIGILVAFSICTILYLLMTVALIGMVPYTEIDTAAAYSAAFRGFGWNWAGHIISFGALFAILTTIFGGFISTSRFIMVVAREGFLPSFMGTVNPKTGTPVNSILFTGLTMAAMTLLLDLNMLAELVSMGVLLIYAFLHIGSIIRRYSDVMDRTEETTFSCSKNLGVRIVLLTICASASALAFNEEWPLVYWIVPTAIYSAVLLSFLALPVVYRSPNFPIPFQPLTPCVGFLFSMHLIFGKDRNAVFCYLVIGCISFAIYLFYGMHNNMTEQAFPYRVLQNDDLVHGQESNF